MLDKSEQELNAVDLAFNTPCYVPEQELNAVDRAVKPLLCDFHRLQAWNRWIKKGENGVPTSKQKVVYKALKQIGDAETSAQFDDLVEAFLLTPESQAQDKKLEHYFKTYWLSCAELWAKCYRQAYHGDINTNNYMESMNRVFKHKWLNGRPDQRLDSLLHVYVHQIVPYYQST
jgi:DNA polymerase I-like protein with 3'-5' exonuclease and polymerase domains